MNTELPSPTRYVVGRVADGISDRRAEKIADVIVDTMKCAGRRISDNDAHLVAEALGAAFQPDNAVYAVLDMTRIVTHRVICRTNFADAQMIRDALSGKATGLMIDMGHSAAVDCLIEQGEGGYLVHPELPERVYRAMASVLGR